MTVALREIAFVRSGDKGDVCNLGVVPYDPRNFDLIKQQVTVERIRDLFGQLVRGDIHRYELPGICAFNFVMQGALQGGVSRSLALDTHGKAFASLALSLEIEVPEGTALRSEAARPCA